MENWRIEGVREFIHFLYISLGSLGESVSGLCGHHKAQQVSDEQHEKLDALAYKIENGMLKLIESLELKRDHGEWIDHLILKESNETYGEET